MSTTQTFREMILNEGLNKPKEIIAFIKQSAMRKYNISSSRFSIAPNWIEIPIGDNYNEFNKFLNGTSFKDKVVIEETGGLYKGMKVTIKK